MSSLPQDSTPSRAGMPTEMPTYTFLGLVVPQHLNKRQRRKGTSPASSRNLYLVGAAYSVAYSPSAPKGIQRSHATPSQNVHVFSTTTVWAVIFLLQIDSREDER
ncbi:hypothetical protein FCV25MIE_24651 [Fagus crenata]